MRKHSFLSFVLASVLDFDSGVLFVVAVLAEDAIKAALNDYKVKNQDDGSTQKESVSG